MGVLFTTRMAVVNLSDVSDHQETSFSGLRPRRPSVQPGGVF
jgi:hypothetical protein